MVNIALLSYKSMIRKALFLIMIIFVIAFSNNAAAQEMDFGVVGGVDITSINKTEDSGLKFGFHLGGLTRHKLNNNSNIAVSLQFSTAGDRYSVWEENSSATKVKSYHSTSLYYINMPVLYQYYFTNILGIELGPRISWCLGGSTKSKIGNDSWDKEKIPYKDINPVSLGLVVGIYTSNFNNGTFENFFIDLRGFWEVTNIIKNSGSNKSMGFQLSIGYIFKS